MSQADTSLVGPDDSGSRMAEQITRGWQDRRRIERETIPLARSGLP